jgi:hypothetical protein
MSERDNMTNEERASVNEKALSNIANQIEEIRIELYSCSVIDDGDEKAWVDDNLFRLQSELRGVATAVGCYS